MCVVIEIGVGKIKHQRLGWNYAYCHTADGIALISVGHIIKFVLAYTGIVGKVDQPSQHTGGNINGVIDEIVDGVIRANDFINYTINVSTSMLAGRVNLTANTGNING